MTTTTKTWVHSIAAAAISSGANAVLVTVVSPSTFNLSGAGLAKLGELIVLSSVVAVALILKQSPLPSDTQTVTATLTQTVETTPNAKQEKP